MESDSSVDGDFDVEYEEGSKVNENPVSGSGELEREGEESESDEGTANSSCESEPEPVELEPQQNTQILRPQSSDAELSGSTCEDGWSNISSGHSKVSNEKIKDSTISETETGKNENGDDKFDHNESCILEDDVEEQVQKKDDSLDVPGQCDELSCVSDIESNDGQSSVDILNNDRNQNSGDSETVVNIGKRKVSDPVEEMEQLDFEAEEMQDKEEKEEGECEIRDEKSDEGELEGDDLEEGELTDEEENRPEEMEPRPVCRFYSRGQCTWGSSCRFVHPGVTDKGNYTMFDVVRPLVPVNGHPAYASVDYRLPYEKLPSTVYQSPVKEEPLVIESAWERGLRQAKEMMRKSNQRKETDMDFEEKKMNLSLGQEELDKENDYYIRSASPVYKEDERWNIEVDPYSYRDETLGMEHYDEVPDMYYHRSRATGRDYWRRVHYESDTTRTIHLEPEYVSFKRERSGSKYHGHHQHRQTTQDFYDKYEKKSRQKSHSTRVVTMEQSDKHRKDERYGETSLPNRRGDEWADPWMRSKSPVARKSGGHASRRRSHSSGSPHSSSGRSRSSSQSSHHSVNHGSRSRIQSKKSSLTMSSSHNISSHAHRNPRKVLLPTPRTVEPSSPVTSSQKSSKHVVETRDYGRNKPVPSTFIQLEKKAASERALLMNPPAPSPQRQKEAQPHSPAMMRRSAQNPPPPASPARSNSSLSSSGSDSSGSSSDSSESSCSSSSSSREPSPKVVYPPKRLIMEERGRLALAESLKVKAMDALKLSGQKQQIKLTLKTSSNVQNKTRTVSGLPDLPQLNLVRKDRVLPVLVGRKRPAENPVGVESGVPAKITTLPKPAQKTVTSRREELLKQLKAVEDAIARKRSKI